jgi:hypothetical protein
LASADTRKPFCFVPSTISPPAQQYLATAAAGTAFGAVNIGQSPQEQAAAVTKLRSVFPGALSNLTLAAEARYIGSKRNATIGGVSAAIAVPLGVHKSAPANTKVVFYLHGGYIHTLLSSKHTQAAQQAAQSHSFDAVHQASVPHKPVAQLGAIVACRGQAPRMGYTPLLTC